MGRVPGTPSPRRMTFSENRSPLFRDMRCALPLAFLSGMIDAREAQEASLWRMSWLGHPDSDMCVVARSYRREARRDASSTLFDSGSGAGGGFARRAVVGGRAD